MPSHGNKRPTSKTPVLQIDSDTFQAAVLAVVTAVMAQLNAINTNKNGIGVDNSNRNNNLGHWRVAAYKNHPNYKSKNMKRKSWNKKGSTSIQWPTKRQRAVAAPTPTDPTTLTSRKPYAGNLPECHKCNFHHQGSCREMECMNYDRNGHTTRCCRVPTWQATQSAKTRMSQVCYECGEIEHFKRGCPRAKNKEVRDARSIATTDLEEAMKDPTVITDTLPPTNSCTCAPSQ